MSIYYNKFQKYNSIEEIVINRLKDEAKEFLETRIGSYTGNMTKAQYKKHADHLKRMKKGSKMLLEAFRLLKY
jgi:hypothetical protein